MAKKKSNAKSTMYAHSVAKVGFFEAYLQRYLRVLYRTQYVNSIRIYDIFCGRGIYENDKKGSPIVIFDVIKQLHSENTNGKKIRLIINDGDDTCVNSVRGYLNDQNQGFCEISYSTLEANGMFQKVIDEVSNTDSNTRNLVFVDPYGYKEIIKETLLKLLSNKRTELLLFLPISLMQRFTQKAIESDESQYEPLKRFISNFFGDNHPIYNAKKTVHEYINYIKYALRFNCKDYFSTSYSLQRDSGNYYALFFLTTHLYGYEKILEVKWELDEIQGKGFTQPKPQQSLFFEEEIKQQKEDMYKRLEDLLRRYLQSPKTNQEVYKLVLHYEFLPKHAIKIFKNWQQNYANFEVTDYLTGEPLNRDGWFYIGWTYCKPQAKPIVTLHFRQ